MKVGCFLLLFWGTTVRGQTFAEWFQQNKTQKKYYREQITALQVYVGAVEKGYAILDSGLSVLRGIQSGEFALHRTFYDGLNGINPAVGKMGEGTEIVSLQAAMVERCNVALKRYRQNARLSAVELAYIDQVYAKLLHAGLTDVDQLMDLVTANRLKLSDDQRMERIRELDIAMKERYGLATQFTNQVDLVGLQRQMEQSSVDQLKALYGVP